MLARVFQFFDQGRFANRTYIAGEPQGSGKPLWLPYWVYHRR